MKGHYAALLPLIFIVMMIGVFAVQAEDAKPLIVEEGTPLRNSPSTITTPQETSAFGYKITTSENDRLCDTGFGGYFDLLEELNIPVTASIPSPKDPDGDSFALESSSPDPFWIQAAHRVPP